MGTQTPVSSARPNRAAQVWVLLLALVAGLTAVLIVCVAVFVGLYAGLLPLLLTVLVWVVLLGAPAALLMRARKSR